MRATNGIISRTDVRLMGLYPLSGASPVDSNRLVTKQWLRSNYYVDALAYPFSVYSDLRCLKYQDVLGSALGPLPNFYQYDVTRSGIPTTGGYFTYTSVLGTTETVLQNSYGYVGRFCMEENSFQNNQWNLYTFTQVGICYPDNNGTGYPVPLSPQYLNTYFTYSPTTHIEGFALYSSNGNPVFTQNGIYNNDYYIDGNSFSPGTYFARYYVYDNGGNFLYKVGYKGYPAKKVVILTEIRYYYTVDIYENCQFVTSETWALESQPSNFWYNTVYRQYNIAGPAPYDPNPSQILPGTYFTDSSCTGQNSGFDDPLT
jgi:hypothetical protein